MTSLQERLEIDRFIERNHLLSSTSAKEMAEKLSALEAPCEIRPIVPSYPYETTIAQATIRTIRVGCMRNRTRLSDARSTIRMLTGSASP
jgi:hypothetical protein